MLQTVRNVAIIALLALAMTAVPGGKATADTILVALSMAFLCAIAWFMYQLYNQQQLTLSTMSDGRRAILFGAIGAIALLVVGYEEFRSWNGGVVLWIGLMACAVGAIFLVWRDATSYG